MAVIVSVGWDAERRAQALAARRAPLLMRLPHKLRDAAPLNPDVRELIVDDAIEFAALHYQPPIASQAELERVFWDAASKRVHRAREGRYSTVRAGYERADLGALEQLPGDADLQDEALARAELSAALQFAATLEPREREVWAAKHAAGGASERGAKRIAQRLGAPLGEIRALERSIEAKRERFAAIYSAGRLCGYLAPAVAALAAGDPGGQLEQAARLHLQLDKCPVCTADYTRQLRYLRSARFHGKVAALLPTATADRPGAVREWLPDWAARLANHDPASTASQLAAGGAGRGIGTATLLKLASVCLAGGALGTCAATGVLPPLRAHTTPPAHHHDAITHNPSRATPHHGAHSGEPPLPPVWISATPTPAHTPQRTHAASHRTPSHATTQGGSSARSHEQTPASPAPANAAPAGASEFNPTYQPTAPQPAPVPAGPGGGEFF